MSSDELWQACTWNRPEFELITPKVARWIYNNLIPAYQSDEDDRWQETRIRLMWVIAQHRNNPPWKAEFFWRVIGGTKSLPICWAFIEVMSGFVGGIEDVPRFIALYEDTTAHPLARGEAIFALGYLQRSSEPGWDEATHDVCLRAFRDPELPMRGLVLAVWRHSLVGLRMRLQPCWTTRLPSSKTGHRWDSTRQIITTNFFSNASRAAYAPFLPSLCAALGWLNAGLEARNIAA